MEFEFIQITSKLEFDRYIDDILALQDYCDKTLAADYWYIQTKREEIEALFEHDGIILCAVLDGKLEAVSIAGNYHADYKESVGKTVKLNTYKCIYYDCVFVDPLQRGKGLQQRMMKETLHIAKQRSYKRAWCLVCPDNIYSKRNIEAVGFREIGQVTHAGSGWVRSVMYREL